MDRIYNIEDAKKKITEDIRYYDYLIKAWEKVKIEGRKRNRIK